jgi:hypothetical protein
LQKNINKIIIYKEDFSMEQNEIIPLLPIGTQLTWEEVQVLEDIDKAEIDYDEFEAYLSEHGGAI